MCFSTNESKLLKNLLAPFSWFIQNKSNKRRTTSLSNHIDFSFMVHPDCSQANSNKNKLNRQQMILLRQMTILNYLVDFFYKLFKFQNVSIKTLLEKSKKSEVELKGQRSSLNSILSYQMDSVNIFQDDFVNAECNEILESTEKLIYQSNSFDLIDDTNNTISSGFYQFFTSQNDQISIS